MYRITEESCRRRCRRVGYRVSEVVGVRIIRLVSGLVVLEKPRVDGEFQSLSGDRVGNEGAGRDGRGENEGSRVKGIDSDPKAERDSLVFTLLRVKRNRGGRTCGGSRAVNILIETPKVTKNNLKIAIRGGFLTLSNLCCFDWCERVPLGRG